MLGPVGDSLSIVHVLSSFGLGGQERVALDLAAGQTAAGHRVRTVSLAAEDGPLRAEFERRGLVVAALPKRGAGVDFRLPLRLTELFRTAEAEVVHTHNPQPLIYAGPAAKIAGAALVHTKHGVNPERGKSVRRRLYQAATLLADAFVAVSESTAGAARAQREGLAARTHVIPNGIDLSRFAGASDARAAIRGELGIPADAFAVATVGRLFEEKGHAFLIRALAPTLGERFHLIVVGEGPERARLAAQVAALPGPGAVHLTGNRGDVPRVLGAVDAFALASVREGLPLVIPEAMAAGLPVVATAVGGVPDVVVEGETGALVVYGDEAALRARLTALDADRSLARRWGAKGRERALSRYSAETMCAAYLDLYRSVVHR
jgi:glycosyltransferase involved in cell wall biosynthesis